MAVEKQNIIDYVMNTPGNSNPAVLGSLIDQYGEGIAPTGSLTIENNGTYDVSEYAEANVSTNYPNDSINCVLTNYSDTTFDIIYYGVKGEIQTKTMAAYSGEPGTAPMVGMLIPYTDASVKMPFARVDSSTALSFSSVFTMERVITNPLTQDTVYIYYLGLNTSTSQPIVTISVENVTNNP